jgi:CubicO group peptidase (beta-lactamase class C family)
MGARCHCRGPGIANRQAVHGRRHSGIANFTGMADFRTIERQEMTAPQMIEYIRRAPLEFRPGERWASRNSGYYLLDLIIEEVSRMRYAAFLEKSIFEPLQMKHTFYDSNQEMQFDRANGYTLIERRVEKAGVISLSIPFAAGALRSNVRQNVRQNAIEHGGDINGFSADAVRIPAAGLYVAILTNCDDQT